MKKRSPVTLAVLPLKNTVVFPQVVVPLAVGRPRSLQLLEDLPAGERTLAVAAQLDESIEEATWEQVYRVGTRVRIEHMIKLPDGSVQLAVRGLERVRLEPAASDRPYLFGRVRPHRERPGRAQGRLVLLAGGEAEAD